MTLYDIIDNGARLVLFAHKGTKTIYTWNQSLIIQKWEERGSRWEEVDAITLSDMPADWQGAQDKVRQLWKV